MNVLKTNLNGVWELIPNDFNIVCPYCQDGMYSKVGEQAGKATIACLNDDCKHLVATANDIETAYELVINDFEQSQLEKTIDFEHPCKPDTMDHYER
jgi:hypothetical protein